LPDQLQSNLGGSYNGLFYQLLARPIAKQSGRELSRLILPTACPTNCKAIWAGATTAKYNYKVKNYKATKYLYLNFINFITFYFITHQSVL